MDLHKYKILILDFGSQYTQLIARRVRELGVYCEIFPWDLAATDIHAFAPQGVILSGGPNSVTETDTPRVDSAVFDLNCPVLGICYGLQAIASQFGGRVSSSAIREFGKKDVEIVKLSPLFAGFTFDAQPNLFQAWMSHGDKVDMLPPQFVTLASTDHSEFTVIAHETKPIYGVQFHPEVTHTLQGTQLLKNFILNICDCQPTWTPQNIIENQITLVKQQVGTDHVILGLSGGVDSSVVAALIHQAIGTQLTCVFVDNGLLRQNEAEDVMALFGRHFGMRVILVNATEEFLSALQGASDPEEKRKIIGRIFINVFEREAAKIKNAKFLAQGTIYPDVIESAAAKTGKAHVIKSHHNVGGLPEEMQLQLLEPLRELFKDEVRRVGLTLGLPAELINRHPFPGPGLGVRILGEIKSEYLAILRQVDAIYIKELQTNGFYNKVSQAFAVFLPVKAVGVKGDARYYDYVVALRAVETTDFMTADWAPLPYEFLAKVSTRIMNEVKGVSRVVYDISSKPPATIEWE